MNWEEWCHWKKRRLVAVILFILAYIVTIPIRGYEFLESFIDITQGIFIWRAFNQLTLTGVLILC